MPSDPVQLILAVFELTLLVGGGSLLMWILTTPRQRERWLGTHSLPQLALSPLEFVLAGATIYVTGVAFATVAHALLASLPKEDMGLKLVVVGMANYLGAYVGWRLFSPSLLRLGKFGPNLPTGRITRQIMPWAEVIGSAIGTVVVALPILLLVSLGWVQFLRAVGLPDDPQDLIKLFAEIKSPWIVAGLLFTACVFAPIYEELLFRAGLYRYTRQKLGRTPALLISGIGFGALHANWAGFLPLAVLGMILAVVYEATGSIRVVIVAHGLFNLNTILVILSGLQSAKP